MTPPWCGAPACDESVLAWEAVGFCEGHVEAAAALREACADTRERWMRRWVEAGCPGGDEWWSATQVIEESGGLTGYRDGAAPDPVRVFA